jgi:crotonyl-CoA reductase
MVAAVDGAAKQRAEARDMAGPGCGRSRVAAPDTVPRMSIEAIRAAILEDAGADELAVIPLPNEFRAVVVLADEQDMFAGMESADKDPRESIHIQDVPLPELASDEVFVAVMASSINFNTVWSSIFEPVPTFGFLERLGRESELGRRHDQPFHVLGSDAAGVVLRTGPAVRNWKVGDRVVVHCNYVDDQDPSSHDDSMLASNQRIWGFESNYGGLADIALVKANQLMPKPAHLTWEEAAVNALTNSTSYRMIVSRNGAQMTQGQTVLVWGAGGGIGAYACQYVLNGGGTPVAVVSSPERAALLREMGVEHIIDRKAEGFRFWKDDTTQDPAEWRRFGKRIRELAGTDPDIVFEHPGRQTMGASVFVAKRGGMIITCAATSGFMIEYDNRYLWMNLKTLKGCHFANYREAWAANRAICEGKVHPTLSAVFDLEDTGEAARQVHRNEHEGKLGILVLAPEEGLGVTDPDMRERLLPQITLFRRHT